MIDYIRKHLGARLFLSYLVVVLVGLAVLAVAGQAALPASFDRHMLGMMVNSDGVVVPGMGMGLGGGAGPQARAQLFRDYRAGFNDALLMAGAAALLVGLVLSVAFSRGVTGPLRAVSRAAERIASGRYDERVPVQGEDEFSQLATRFNEMAEKLEDVEAMRRRLIGDVSHELRTPLTAIQGSMEGLMDGMLPANRDTFADIHAEAQRLNRLVDDLQELSRVEAHAYELKLQPVEVRGLIGSVIKRLEPQARARGIALTYRGAQALPPVRADDDRLIQVLSNLCTNALQYAPRGGTVSITATSAGGEILIAVHDTGVGISAADLPHIFDRFYRADKSRSRREGAGSGIGLTIARALVEAHGGRIWAESEGAGRGATFTIALPVGK